MRYLKWASYEKPAIFYSVVIGALGPVVLVAAPPLRRISGDVNPARIPLTYPSELSKRREEYIADKHHSSSRTEENA